MFEQESAQNLLNSLQTVYKNSDLTYNPNGFNHVMSKRYGGEEMIKYLSTSGHLSSVVKHDVVLTPSVNGKGISIDQVGNGHLPPVGSVILPRYHMEVEIVEPLEVVVPDLLVMLGDLFYRGSKRPLIDLIEDYGWQAAIVGLGSLPKAGDVFECFNVIKDWGRYMSSVDKLDSDPEIVADNYRWLELDSPLSSVKHNSYNMFQRLWGVNKIKFSGNFLEKEYFDNTIKLITFLHGSDDWFDRYRLDVIRKVPLTISSGVIKIVFRTVAEEILVAAFSHSNRTNIRKNYSGIDYKEHTNKVSQIPVTYYLTDVRSIDSTPAIEENVRSFYYYPICGPN